VLALALVAVAVVAAVRVLPDVSGPVGGLTPGVPADVDVPFVLPWIGTILAGSMGIVWYSYWAATRGYGGGAADLSEGEGAETPDEDESSTEQRHDRFSAWLRTMSNTAALGVLTGTVIITSFLVLGAELLGPAGVVPSGVEVADELTNLLSEVWGRAGFWLMTVAIVVALGGSVLANQDGWSRSFADITLLLPLRGEDEGGDRQADHGPAWLRWLIRWRPDGMGPRRGLKILFAVTVTGVLPAIVIIVVRDPVAIMSVSGIIAAVHTPFIVFTTMLLKRRLPPMGRPGTAISAALGLAGCFYTVFAGLFVADLVGIVG